MDSNVGVTDKRVRTALGAVAGSLSLATLAGVGSLPATAGPVLGIVALAMLGTALTGTCGLYSVLGVDTCSVNASDRR
jgi:hypothetical protein